MSPVDDEATQAALTALIAKINRAAEIIAGSSAHIVQQLGMERTHVITGTLRRSWRVVGPEGGDGVYRAAVGPTMIYARRQELGFVGPDSLGRVFKNDPGWPYVRPAREAAQVPVQQLAVTTLRAAIGA